MDLKDDELAIALPLLLFGTYIPMPPVAVGEERVVERPDYWLPTDRQEKGEERIFIGGNHAVSRLSQQLEQSTMTDKTTLFLAPMPPPAPPLPQRNAAPFAAMFRNDALFLRSEDPDEWVALN